MSIQLGRRFWMVATVAFLIFTLFLMGRNLLHAMKIKRQVDALSREMAYYRGRIAQDSTLLEHLRYDDYLEEFARETFKMQRRDEWVYILKE
ncbi:MAG: septum formation initiator family protein [Alistipes sp.]